MKKLLSDVIRLMSVAMLAATAWGTAAPTAARAIHLPDVAPLPPPPQLETPHSMTEMPERPFATSDEMILLDCRQRAEEIRRIEDAQRQFFAPGLQYLQQPQAALQPDATNPSIQVNLGNFRNFNGSGTPNAALTWRVLRGGTAIASGRTTISSGGYYSVFPNQSYDCPNARYVYDWQLQPGDTVEVTAGGSPISTVVANLGSLSADPATNIVRGKSTPGSSVQVIVLHTSLTDCAFTPFTFTATTDAAGDFSLSTTSLVDFNNNAAVTVNVYDGNGNLTYLNIAAHGIQVFGGKSIYATVLPNTATTLLVRRLGTPVLTQAKTSETDGRVSFTNGIDLQAGDEVRITSGSLNLQINISALNIKLSSETNQLTIASAIPGRTIRAYIYGGGYNTNAPKTRCVGSPYACATGTTDGSGSLALTASFDVAPGDTGIAYIYDSNGNYQYGFALAPVLGVDLGNNMVHGFWDLTNGLQNTSTVTLNVRVRDAGNATLFTGAFQTSIYDYDGEFEFRGVPALAVGNNVDVSNGGVTRTMTIQNVTAQLNGSTVNGTAGNGVVTVDYQDYQRSRGYSSNVCASGVVSAGSFNINISNVQPDGQDRATVNVAGADGGVTQRRISNLSVRVNMLVDGQMGITGYARQSAVPVTGTITRAGTPLFSASATSYGDGYFSLGSSVTFSVQAGDVIRVQTGDGSAVTLTTPALTAVLNRATGVLTGTAPANEPVQVYVRLVGGNTNGWSNTNSRIIQSTNSGNYSQSFSGEWIGYGNQCSTLAAGVCATGIAYYTNADGHSFYYVEPATTLAPDSFEGDDNTATTQSYAGVQSRTFHTISDTDHVSITISAADVSAGMRYEALTFEHGFGLAIRLNVTGPGTAVSSSSSNTSSNRVGWQPASPGVYYIRIDQTNSPIHVTCNAKYKLAVLAVRSRVHLPFTVR